MSYISCPRPSPSILRSSCHFSKYIMCLRAASRLWTKYCVFWCLVIWNNILIPFVLYEGIFQSSFYIRTSKNVLLVYLVWCFYFMMYFMMYYYYHFHINILKPWDCNRQTMWLWSAAIPLNVLKGTLWKCLKIWD